MERIISILVILVLTAGTSVSAQSKNWERSLRKHRKKKERSFRTPEKSPLRDQADEFVGNEYFPADPAFKVTASVELTPDSEPFELITSDPNRKKWYVRYAILHFEIDQTPCSLEIYRSVALQGMPAYKDHLFLPFTDLTTGESTYGGGRYLDMEVTEGETMDIDFNYAYNPYCAYRSDGWSCPIPPDANRLPVAITAGVKDYHGGDH